MKGGDAARQIAPDHLLEAGIAHHRGQLGLRRKTADALDEILISVAILGDDATEPRQYGKRIKIVDAAQQRRLDAAEFEAEKPPARLQYAARLRQSALFARDIAQPERNRAG